MLPSKQRILSFLMALALVAGVAAYSGALMPPHITETIPKNGGELKDPTIIIHGYSIIYANTNELILTDLTAQEKVETTMDMKSIWKGTGDRPGARQVYCTLSVALKKACPGHEYELKFLQQTIRFTYRGEAVNCP